jgi:methyl-accepting chemotaxis protein
MTKRESSDAASGTADKTTGPDESGTGQTRTDGGALADGDASGGAQSPLGYHAILNHIDTPIFVVNADGEITNWNRSLQRLTGESEEGARELQAEHGVIGPAFYHDGRRSMTLAEKVLEAPESADQEHGVPRVDDVDYTLYADESVMKDSRGRERHIEFSAAPIYENGELAGVVEMIHDRTEDALQQQQLQAMVTELQDTMAEIEAGNLKARASVEETDHIDDDLVGVVDSLNQMTERLSDIVADVADQTGDLHDSVESVADTSQHISKLADGQSDTLATVSDEVANLSATIEEIASTSDEVAATAHDADDAATAVQETAEQTQAVMEDVSESANAVAADVETLRKRVDEVDEIVEVIDNIAEQTNMLALNASIEAARAGEAGSGFAVVADEVKSLAEESQQRAGEIEEMVSRIKADTRDTVENLEETNRQVDRGLEQVEDSTAALTDIVTAVEETAEGIEQVSDATDDQASSTEQIASMLDEVVTRAEEVSDEVQNAAATTEEQAEKVDKINDTVHRLASEAYVD